MGGSNAQLLAPVTGDRLVLQAALSRVFDRNLVWDPVAAVEAATTALADARAAAGGPPPDDQFMLVMMDYVQGRPAQQLVTAARKARADGIHVLLVSWALQELRGVPDSAADWFTISNWVESESPQATAAAARALGAVDRRFKPRLPASGIVADVVPGNLRFVPASAAPAAGWDPASRTVSWSLPDIPSAGITMTYELEPLECGVWPTNVEAVAEVEDTSGASYSHAYPVPTVNVICPVPTSTPPPSATVTASPTYTPTPSLTPVDTPAVTPTPAAPSRPVYLPLALGEACVVGRRTMDVTLVIDASTSMMDPTRTGGTKLAAAVAAVSVFLDELRLDAGDQAAIIAFNADAHVLQRPTSERRLLDAALGRIETALTTRLDLAVSAGHAVLTGPEHRPGNAAALVLLTDGRANPVGPEVAVVRAAEAKAAGITIFTIGLGEDLDLAALATIASRPAYFYRAPYAEHLAGIYRAIAVEIPCPGEAYWAGR